MYFLLMFQLSFHLMMRRGGWGKANVFVVKGPKKNFKQRSGRRGCLNVRVAFKSKTFFLGWGFFFFLLSQFLGSLRLVN